MATRGTYQIEGMLLYNHWDNYPSGTAYHFIEVIKKFGDLSLFSVIRGMDKIEKTGNIYDGRAEFHYKIIDGKIGCYSIAFDKDKLVPHSSGDIAEWINNAIKPSLDDKDNIEDYMIIKMSSKRYTTLSQLRSYISSKFEHAKKITDCGSIGNGSHLFMELFQMIRKSGLSFDEMKKEYLNKYSPLFAESYKHDSTDHFDSYVNGEDHP